MIYRCSTFFPYQTCESVCGPAVIAGISMAVFAPAEFQKMTISDAMDLFGHNHDISHFSKYIRYVITE